jgi:hypothetical protein
VTHPSDASQLDEQDDFQSSSSKSPSAPAVTSGLNVDAAGGRDDIRQIDGRLYLHE